MYMCIDKDNYMICKLMRGAHSVYDNGQSSDIFQLCILWPNVNCLAQYVDRVRENLVSLTTTTHAACLHCIAN